MHGSALTFDYCIVHGSRHHRGVIVGHATRYGPLLLDDCADEFAGGKLAHSTQRLQSASKAHFQRKNATVLLSADTELSSDSWQEQPTVTEQLVRIWPTFQFKTESSLQISP